jgi:hypothetical protein
MKGLTGYAEMMLENPANPQIGGIGVQTICRGGEAIFWELYTMLSKAKSQLRLDL